MSDYERCEKHNISYLMPEILECPYCFLERKKSELEGKEDYESRYDVDMYESVASILDDYYAD